MKLLAERQEALRCRNPLDALADAIQERADMWRTGPDITATARAEMVKELEWATALVRSWIANDDSDYPPAGGQSL